MKKLLYLIVFIVFALFAVTLNMKNPQAIPVNYYFGINWNVSLFWVIMLPFFVGMLLGVLVMGLSVFKNKRQVSKSKKALAKVEKEVEGLRAKPVDESASKSISSNSGSVSVTP